MAMRRARPVVLVVDDNALVRDTFYAILEEDFDVLDAPDGRAAMDLARTAPIDVVILDILLPEMDGLTVLAELRTVRPGARVVVVSGVDRAAAAATAIRLGAVDYLTKPFENTALLAAVHAALQEVPGALPLPGERPGPSLAVIGCPTTIVAAIAAALEPDIAVHSHRDLTSADEVARRGIPSLIVLDTRARPLDWLEHAALLLDRFPGTRSLALSDATRYMDVRFALGEGCGIVQPPFALAPLLDHVCTALPEAPRRQPWHDKRAAGVIEGVCGNCAGFSLSAVAHRLGVSPHYLSRWFQQCAGVALSAYLTRVRVYAARHLLQQEEKKIEAAARAVGFHDASHLSRAYVQVTGHRPGQDRIAPRPLAG
jgi:CheY-like chemotaxis protein/AraC-like DNA-binding protein